MSERNNEGNNFTEINKTKKFDIIKNVHHYKIITDIMENHLNDPKNLFCKLINKFIQFYMSKYQKFINKKESYPIQERKKWINEAKDDLKQFVRILYESLKKFYSLNKLNSINAVNDKSKKKKKNKESLFTRDNIINFLTSIIFQKSNVNKKNSKYDKNKAQKTKEKNDNPNKPKVEITDIYSIVIEVLSIEDLGKEDYFKSALNLVENYEPEEFGLDPRFCLNMRTIEYLEKKHKKHFILPLKDSTILAPVKSSIIEYPYGKAIEILRTIDQQRSPLHKLKVISNTAKAISVCIIVSICLILINLMEIIHYQFLCI